MIAGEGPIMKLDGCLCLRQQAASDTEALSITINCKCSH